MHLVVQLLLLLLPPPATYNQVATAILNQSPGIATVQLKFKLTLARGEHVCVH